jgi:hypothetical protein
MAIRIPIITDLQDQGLKQAKLAFANFKTSVAEAEGGMNKFKAGSKSVLDAVGANAQAFAVAGGIAFAKFAMEGVKAFQDLALASGKFADATGLAIEDASRWKEVAGDIGIGSDSVQTAINKMNKTLGTSPDLFSQLGVEIARTNTGAMDVSGTFLNVIDKLNSIKDPAERAKVATQLLGKGWTDLAALIAVGSDGLRKSLKGVSDTKVISPAELKKAQEYRDAMDKLSDAVDDVKLALGESLIPLLTDVADMFGKIDDVRGWITDLPGVSTFMSFMSKITNPISLATSAWDGLSSAVGSVWGWFSDAPDEPEIIKDLPSGSESAAAAIKKLNIELSIELGYISDVTEALISADTAWKVLTGNLDQEVALDNAKTKLAELEAAAKKAFGSGSQKDIDDYDAKAAEFVGMLAAISGGMDDISSNEILLRFKTQGPAAALELATWIANGAEFGGLSQSDLIGMAGLSIPGFASGGSVSGGPILVGEKGPEIFVPGQAGTIIPNNAIGSSGNGNTITVNVNGGDPDAVVRAIQKYARQNGAIPLQTTTSARF